MGEITDPESDLLCPHCGYNLRGTTSAKCSECGRDIDRASMAVSQIPWAHRAEIGRIKSFLRTCALAGWKPGRMAEEMNRPQTLRDAMSFRRVLVVTLSVPVWAAILWLNHIASKMWPSHFWDFNKDTLPAFVRYFIPPPCGVSLLIVLTPFFWWGITGVTSAFVRPRSMPPSHQKRAVAISYYLAAAWLWIYGIFIVIALEKFDATLPVESIHWLFLLAQVLILGIFLWRIWLTPLGFIRTIRRCGIAWTAWVGAALPLCWLMMAGIMATLIVLAAAIDLIWQTRL